MSDFMIGFLIGFLIGQCLIKIVLILINNQRIRKMAFEIKYGLDDDQVTWFGIIGNWHFGTYGHSLVWKDMAGSAQIFEVDDQMFSCLRHASKSFRMNATDKETARRIIKFKEFYEKD